jgi:hypothetical protein
MLPIFARIYCAGDAPGDEDATTMELFQGKRVRDLFSLEQEAFIRTIARKHLRVSFAHILDAKEVPVDEPARKKCRLTAGCFFIPVPEDDTEEEDCSDEEQEEHEDHEHEDLVDMRNNVAAGMPATKHYSLILGVEDAKYYFQVKEGLSMTSSGKGQPELLDSLHWEDKDKEQKHQDQDQSPPKVAAVATATAAVTTSSGNVPGRPSLRIVSPEKLQEPSARLLAVTQETATRESPAAMRALFSGAAAEGPTVGQHMPLAMLYSGDNQVAVAAVHTSTKENLKHWALPKCKLAMRKRVNTGTESFW